MTEKAKNKLLWIFISVIVAIILIGNAGGMSLSEPTPKPEYITLPTIPELDRYDPNFVSPYDPNDKYVGAVVKVWQESLRVDGMQVVTSSNPNHTNTVDVEDVVTVKLMRQNIDADINKAKILIVAQDTMQDPYITHPTKYRTICEGRFEQAEDGTWFSQFMLGYSDETYTHIAMLFVYDNDIEYFSGLRVTRNYTYSKLYYQWLTPDKEIAEMHFIDGDKKYTYCYYPEYTSTLTEWVKNSTNHAGWMIVQNIIVASDATCYIAADDVLQQLYDGIQIPLHRAENNRLPIAPPDIDTESTEWLTRFMSVDKSVVIAQLGDPLYESTFSTITKLEYPNYHFYIDDTDGVIQINLRCNTQLLPPELPTTAMTGEELTTHLLMNGIQYHDIVNIGNASVQHYAYRLSVPLKNCTISYVWESEIQISSSYDEFTRIVIHTGEEYIY